MSSLPVIPEWEPVLAAELASDGGAARGPQIASPDRQRIEEKAIELEIQPLRWPPGHATDTRQAMLAATYAKRIGRAVAFSLAAFRQTFAGGRDIGDEQTVLIAAAAAEMHPAALLKGIALKSVTDALARATDRAQAAGVTSLPAIQIGELTLHGEDVIDEAARTLGAHR
jgi:2-hydroxychromene-2-carboxylate isomerase